MLFSGCQIPVRFLAALYFEDARHPRTSSIIRCDVFQDLRALFRRDPAEPFKRYFLLSGRREASASVIRLNGCKTRKMIRQRPIVLADERICGPLLRTVRQSFGFLYCQRPTNLQLRFTRLKLGPDVPARLISDESELHFFLVQTISGATRTPSWVKAPSTAPRSLTLAL